MIKGNNYLFLLNKRVKTYSELMELLDSKSLKDMIKEDEIPFVWKINGAKLNRVTKIPPIY